MLLNDKKDNEFWFKICIWQTFGIFIDLSIEIGLGVGVSTLKKVKWIICKNSCERWYPSHIRMIPEWQWIIPEWYPNNIRATF